MRITYKTVKAWLESAAAKGCTVGELNYLASTLNTLIATAEERENAARRKLDQVEMEAKKLGFASLAAMQRALDQTAKPAAPGRELAPPRRPYLVPDDPHTEAYAVYKDRMPAAIKEFLERNRDWAPEELHYKRIAGARKVRGLPADKPYDPIKKHAELMSTAQLKPRRKQS